MDYRQGRQDAKRVLKEPGSRLDDFAHRVIGAAIEVHRHLGPGFAEIVYEEALAIEFGLRQIPYVRQAPVEVRYKGHSVGHGRADFLVGGSLVVEVKAVTQLLPVHNAQVISYLKAIGGGLGLLMNFKEPMMRQGIKRVIWGASGRRSDRDDDAGEVHEAHEARAGFFVSSRDASVPLQVVEEDLDAIA